MTALPGAGFKRFVLKPPKIIREHCFTCRHVINSDHKFVLISKVIAGVKHFGLSHVEGTCPQ